MKTITVDQLSELTWSVESIECGDHHFEVFEGAQGQFVDVDEDGEPIMEPRYSSFLNGVCKLRSIEHPEIAYEVEWQAQGGTETFIGAYKFDVTIYEHTSNVLEVDDFEVFDIDGDVITPSEAEEQIGMEIMAKVEWEHEVKKHLPTPPAPVSIDDTDKDSDMQTYELERDDGPDVKFMGEEMASATSRDHLRNSPRWTELALYRTEGGKLVCHEIGRTQFEGERTRYKLHIAETEAELIKSLGYGWLAKDLYDEAGIEHAERID